LFFLFVLNFIILINLILLLLLCILSHIFLYVLSAFASFS
jgi:hypothetical protein